MEMRIILVRGVSIMSYNYDALLQEGLEFQDYITEKLYDLGIVLINYRSRKYSYKAENKFGMEVKLDRNFRVTKNLYIETAERTNSDNNFVPSGVCRKDNSWLWVIGDRKTVWIFAKKHLLKFEGKCRHVETETSKAFLFPLDKADEWCIQKLEFNEDEESMV